MFSLSNRRVARWAFPWVSLVFRFWARLFAPRLRVTGRHNIPRYGRVIFAPNHISNVDPQFIGAALRYPARYMAKKTLWDIAWLHFPLQFFGAFPVNTGAPDRAALKMALEVLAAHQPLVIFPEGFVSEDAQLGEIMAGVATLALKSGATVIPVGLYGLDKISPYGETVPRPTLARVAMHFGEPLWLDDLREMPSKTAREHLNQRLKNGILAAYEKARDTR